MKPSQCLMLFLTISVAVAPMVQATGIHYHAKKAVKSVARSVKTGIFLHALAAKKALIFGLPVLAAKGAFVAGTSAAGAMIGAPIGAIAGAKVGAGVGAIKGAAVGKGILVLKKALALKLLAAKKAIIAKKILVGAAIKAALISHKIALVGKGMTLAGKALEIKGRAMTTAGLKITGVSAKIKGLKAALAAKIAASLVIPAAPIVAAKVPIYQGPKFANVAWNMAHPIVGFRYGSASVGGIRKKRDTESEQNETSDQRPMNELITMVQSRNAQQCLSKVICELSADPAFHGDEGAKFAGTLKALGRTNLPRVEQFRSAQMAGARSRDPIVCSQSFSDCGTPSAEVIKIGNALISG